MGWCSATTVFDAVAAFVLTATSDEQSKVDVLTTLARALEDADWDCQRDSHYYDDPIVQRVFRELHPRWFEHAD